MGGSTDGLALMDNLQAAKMDDPPMLWAGDGRIRGKWSWGQLQAGKYQLIGFKRRSRIVSRGFKRFIL